MPRASRRSSSCFAGPEGRRPHGVAPCSVRRFGWCAVRAPQSLTHAPVVFNSQMRLTLWSRSTSEDRSKKNTRRTGQPAAPAPLAWLRHARVGQQPTNTGGNAARLEGCRGQTSAWRLGHAVARRPRLTGGLGDQRCAALASRQAALPGPPAPPDGAEICVGGPNLLLGTRAVPESLPRPTIKLKQPEVLRPPRLRSAMTRLTPRDPDRQARVPPPHLPDLALHGLVVSCSDRAYR